MKRVRKGESRREEAVKDEHGQLLVEGGAVHKRWAEYFEGLLNVQDDREARIAAVGGGRMPLVGDGNDRLITRREVLEAVNETKAGKAPGMDGCRAEYLKKRGGSMLDLMLSLLFQLLGISLEGSGWTGALVQANVTSTGTAESFIHVSHVTKTCHAHQVTAAALFALLQSAFENYKVSCAESDLEVTDFEEWCVSHAEYAPQFAFWLKTLDLQLMLLLFIRSLREGNFDLYAQTLVKAMPWMFALDRTHYAQ